MRALAVALALAASSALAQDGPVETPLGPARVEGEAFSDEGLRLIVGDRELLRSTEDMAIWPAAVVGNLLLVGLASGGTACAAQWRWVNLRTGAATEPFGTCSDSAEVSAVEEDRVVVTMPSWNPDFPRSDFVYNGATMTEVPLPQEPAAVPPGTPGDAWIGRYPYEIFVASDWRGPLVALLGAEGYDLAQEAFGIAGPFEAQGEWVAGWGCMAHACGVLGGAVAIHRGDGRLLVAIAGEEEPPRLWGDPQGPLPPMLAEAMAGP